MNGDAGASGDQAAIRAVIDAVTAAVRAKGVASNWLCFTLGLRKVDGHWKVAHQHVSVPFDMKTGKAMLDLEP